MINFLLQYPLFYRLYQKTVRKKNHEYDLFKFIFSEICKNKKIKMLDLCSGDSFILKYIGNYIHDYIGIDNNAKYLKKLKTVFTNFNFIDANINELNDITEIKNFQPNLIFMNGAIHHLDDKKMQSIISFINKFENCIFLSVDPVRFQNKLINKLMIFFDRGKFIRNNNQFKKVLPNFHQFIVDDFYQMSFQNIFHYNNIDIPKFYKDWRKSIK